MQTASLLTFTIYLLSIHPDVFRRLRQEVLSRSTRESMPSFDIIRNMPYRALHSLGRLAYALTRLRVRAVLNETLRLFSPVPTNQRGTTAAGSVLPPTRPGDKPLYVPPHTDMFFLLLHMHRDPALWGDDSMEFDPDRWIDQDKLKPYLANPMIFLPFNGGPRIVCIVFTKPKVP